MEDLVYIAEGNKDEYVHDFMPIMTGTKTKFELGFHEAMDFLQYIGCYFNIAVANELWPPKNEYEKEHTYDEKGVIVYNHFWSKYENIVQCSGEECDIKTRGPDSPYKFYNSLDYNNRRVLYLWYKQSVKN